MQQPSTVNDNTFLNDIDNIKQNIKSLYDNLKTKIENLQKNVEVFCKENQPRDYFNNTNKQNFEELTTKISIESKLSIQDVIDTIIRDTNYYIYQDIINEITTQNTTIGTLITLFPKTEKKNTNVYTCNSIILIKVNRIILEPITNYLKNIISIGEYDEDAFKVSLLKNIPNPIELPNNTKLRNNTNNHINLICLY